MLENTPSEVWSREELSQLDSNTSIERIKLIGAKLKTVENDSDDGQKREVLKPIRSYLPFSDQNVELLSSDYSIVRLELLRCLFWLLKTGMIEPKVNIIGQCLQVADLMPHFSVLLYVVKIVNQLSSLIRPEPRLLLFGANVNSDTYVGNILADENGAARIAMALKQTAPSITDDKIKGFEFIADQLNHWFIFVQRKLSCPVAKKDVAELMEYFTTILLEKHTSIDDLALSIRNILVILFNFQSKSDQEKYVSKCVKGLDRNDPAWAQLSRVKQILKMLEKLAVRGKSGMIRRSENNAILEHLVRICLSFKDSDPTSVVGTSLKLLSVLYESPHYIEEHNVLKTEEFAKFLTRGAAAKKHKDGCSEILRFLILNDPQNQILGQNIHDNDELIQLLEHDRHGCRIIGFDFDFESSIPFINRLIEGVSRNTQWLTFVWIVFCYLCDTLVDLVLIGISFSWPLSWLLLSFAILPILVCHWISLNNFYSTTPLSVYVSLEGHVPRYRLRKYVFPWRFDSLKHTIFNLLTLFMLHPVITATELLFHHVQPVEKIYKSRYNIQKLMCLENMLENIPCLAIKIVLVATQIEEGQFSWTWTNIYTMFSIAFSVLYSKSYSFLTFETLARHVDYDYFQIQLISQKAVVYLGYTTMISSRMLLFLILSRFGLLVLIVGVSLHMFTTFLTHLCTYHTRAEKDGDEDEHFVFLKRFDFWLIPFASTELFSIQLRSPMEYLGVFSSYQYARTWRQFFCIYSWYVAEAFIICFIFLKGNTTIQTDQLINISLFIVSIGLCVISGIFFAVYFFVVHPNRRETYDVAPDNQSSDYDFDWKKKPCQKVVETTRPLSNDEVDGMRMT